MRIKRSYFPPFFHWKSLNVRYTNKCFLKASQVTSKSIKCKNSRTVEIDNARVNNEFNFVRKQNSYTTLAIIWLKLLTVAFEVWSTHFRVERLFFFLSGILSPSFFHALIFWEKKIESFCFRVLFIFINRLIHNPHVVFGIRYLNAILLEIFL